MTPTWYDVLGVSPKATPDEIKGAWRAATDKFEPGVGNSSQFRMFSEAADVLLDPDRRTAYDATLTGLSEASDPADPVAASDEAAPEASALEESIGEKSATATPRPANRLVGLLVVGVLPVLTAAAVALAIVFGLQARQDSQVEDAKAQAQAAAERGMAQVFSYDYQRLPADRRSASKFLTSEYRKEYLKNFRLLEVGKDGKPGPAVTTKTVVNAKVMGTAISSATPDRVRVVVYLNQETKRPDAEASIFQNRTRVTMAKVGSDWLIAKVETY